MSSLCGGSQSSMIIVAGHLLVDAAERDAYLTECEEVVRLARIAPGCLDFAIGADLLDETCINVFERWATRDELMAFRGSGPSEEQNATILSASVEEYDVA
jgi:quinol monooxygenase YgiN